MEALIRYEDVYDMGRSVAYGQWGAVGALTARATQEGVLGEKKNVLATLGRSFSLPPTPSLGGGGGWGWVERD